MASLRLRFWLGLSDAIDRVDDAVLVVRLALLRADVALVRADTAILSARRMLRRSHLWAICKASDATDWGEPGPIVSGAFDEEEPRVN